MGNFFYIQNYGRRKIKYFSVKLQDHLIKQYVGTIKMEYPCSGSEISILKPELKKYTIDSATKRHEQALV